MGSGARALQSGESLDLSFLGWPQQKGPYLFFERTRYHLDVNASGWPASVRKTIADLDLNYYLPCTVRGRTVAHLGVSRTETGEFLSSDDVELLLTLSNYVGIAIENRRDTASRPSIPGISTILSSQPRASRKLPGWGFR